MIGTTTNPPRRCLGGYIPRETAFNKYPSGVNRHKAMRRDMPLTTPLGPLVRSGRSRFTAPHCPPPPRFLAQLAKQKACTVFCCRSGQFQCTVEAHEAFCLRTGMAVCQLLASWQQRSCCATFDANSNWLEISLRVSRESGLHFPLSVRRKAELCVLLLDLQSCFHT
ncbi:hypothetical protein EJ06DRAFT_95318 [Trichodelitschia bisporula]|uniref:Uncharacterized protein n=1 Tax=Trichodelitschia bisporula TaxID=703511 RepID=A0A6G1HSW9_9PEZI|nr:hypothetical protein EJ06DRAFT_95318 [Trichodelitschia bisporula]